jgi:hypothetical protein
MSISPDTHAVDTLPIIPLANRNLRDITAEALASLVSANSPPVIFIRGGKLVRLIGDENNRPVIEEVSVDILRSRLERVANFRSNNDGDSRPKEPPLSVVKDILALGSWNLPPLVSVVESPVLRPDGSVLSENGYDPQTGLYLHLSPTLDFGKIPDNPTDVQISDALALLQEVIADFPFVDEASKANTLGLFLTPIVRPAIAGNIPLALLDAPQAGTGKSLLGDIAAITATGQGPTQLPYSTSSEEMRKKITSALMADASIIEFDNLNVELNSEALASALTSREWGDRKLGSNDMVRVPQLATWIVNGNNIRLGGDLPRRCYWIRLDAEMSRPWQREDFKHPNLLEWVHEQRGRLISAALTLARAWVVAGKPVAPGVRIGGFNEWANVVGGILENAGVVSFLGNLELMYDTTDEEGEQWESFLLELYDHYPNSWVTTADICEHLKLYSSLVDLLPDELGLPFKYDGEVDPKFKQQLGRELKKRVGTRFGSSQAHLEREEDPHKKVARWHITCGDAGTRGDSTSQSEINPTVGSFKEEGPTVPATPALPATTGECAVFSESGGAEWARKANGGDYCPPCSPSRPALDPLDVSYAGPDISQPCWACHTMSWSERPKEAGGGFYCSTCHPGTTG